MMCKLILYFLHFLVLFTRETNSQGGYCRQKNPVVYVCSVNELTNQTDVYIDTVYVPLLEESVCECIISSFVIGAQFSISYNDNQFPRNMDFKLNGVMLTSAGITTAWTTETAKLTLLTTKNHTNEGTCLVVSTDDNVIFNVTCMKSTNSAKVSSTSSTLEGNETPTGQKIIVPVVAALTGLVVLVIVIVVIIVYRRRSTKKEGQSATSSSYVEKEEDNDYYMTENPMYNATDILPKAQNSDNEYHYIEHDNHGDRMSANQYESFPDSPLRKQGAAKETDKEEHYDYSTCLSNSQKGLSAVVNEQTLATKSDGTSLPKNQSADIENTYDRTDQLAKPFVGENEYHHLTPAGSRKKTALVTYHTVGSVGDNKHEQEENGEESEYHVTSLR